MYKSFTLLFCSFLFPIALFAGGENRITRQPIHDLPPHVQAAEGQVSIYADYSKVKEGVVPVYVINKSCNEALIPSQDGDVLLKLQGQDCKGNWTLGEGHRGSGCGNSYYNVKLPASQFFVIHKSVPTTGEKRKIRFKTYSDFNLVSNEGEGTIPEADLEKYKFNSLSLETADYDFLESILLGKIQVPQGSKDAAVTDHLIFYYLSRLSDPRVSDLLLRFVKDETIKLERFKLAWQALLERKNSPIVLLERTKQILRDKTHKTHRYRDYVLKALRVDQEVWNADQELAQLLYAFAHDPSDPNYMSAVQAYSQYKTEDARTLLKRLSDRSNSNSKMRKEALILLASRFPNRVYSADLNIVDRQNSRSSTVLRISITNTSMAPISFEYRDATEIVELNCSYFENSKSISCEKMDRSPDTKVKQVTIEPNQKHDIEFDFRHFFKIQKKGRVTISIDTVVGLPGLDVSPIPGGVTAGYELE